MEKVRKRSQGEEEKLKEDAVIGEGFVAEIDGALAVMQMNVYGMKWRMCLILLQIYNFWVFLDQ